MDMSLPHEQIVRALVQNELTASEVEEKMLYAQSRGYLDTELKLRACLNVYCDFLRMKANAISGAING